MREKTMAEKTLPLPWRTTQPFVDDDGETIIQIEDDMQMIGEVYAGETSEGFENARLAAAAPELVERLRELVDFSLDDTHYRHADRSKAARHDARALLNRLGR